MLQEPVSAKSRDCALLTEGSQSCSQRSQHGTHVLPAGTITVGDIGVVTQFAIDSLAVSTAAAQNLSHKYDIKARHSALTCVRTWAAKGYQPIYVSGRQGSYYNLTMEWYALP